MDICVGSLCASAGRQHAASHKSDNKGLLFLLRGTYSSPCYDCVVAALHVTRSTGKDKVLMDVVFPLVLEPKALEPKALEPKVAYGQPTHVNITLSCLGIALHRSNRHVLHLCLS